MLNNPKFFGFTLNPQIFLPVRNAIIGRGVKIYQWDILPITVKHVLKDIDWGFKGEIVDKYMTDHNFILTF